MHEGPISQFSDVQRILVHTNRWIENSSLNHKINQQRNIPDIDDPESFFRAMRPFLTMFQMIGILPLKGIRNLTPNMLRFKIRSFQTCYSFIIIIFLASRFISCINYLIALKYRGVTGDMFETIACALFFFHTQSAMMFSIWLSPRWIKLQQEWRLMEKKLDSFNQDRPRLQCKFRIISSIMLCLGITDHSLWFINISSRSEKYDGIWNDYSIYTYIDFNNTTSKTLKNWKFGNIIHLIIESIAALVWTSIDLLIILVSTGLAERYKFLNKTVTESIMNNVCEVNWLHVREKYTILSHLVKQTDEYISPLIVLSFICNLFYMCLQLFDGISLKGNETFFEAISFFFTFVFVLLRTVVMTLSAARIHDQSKKILPMLYKCPSSSFTIETKRLQYQLTSDEVALTGMNFFPLKRNLLLAVVGTIITYEIVLLRFNAKSE